jgi:hypothetical protein
MTEREGDTISCGVLVFHRLSGRRPLTVFTASFIILFTAVYIPVIFMKEDSVIMPFPRVSYSSKWV